MLASGNFGREYEMTKQPRRSAVDPEIAKKAAQLKVPSQEEIALGRIFGKDGVGEIYEWGRSQGDLKLDLIGAIRRLVKIGLTVKTRPKQSSLVCAERASEIAAAAIDDLIDPAAPTEEAANRKRRLLKGPEEFQDVRIDCGRKH
jgi:hypothetical protein